MPVSDADIVNEALQMIGDNTPAVQGSSPTFDNSTAGIAAQSLYVPTVEAVGRLFEWDMARHTIALTATGNVAPFPWGFEYNYPTNGIEVWQLLPTTIPDRNNPLPINWVTANRVVGSSQKRVIHTDLEEALAVYNNNPGPDVWDSLFKESVVRLLASKFAMAVAGKPERAANLLDSFNAFVGTAKLRES